MTDRNSAVSETFVQNATFLRDQQNSFVNGEKVIDKS